MCVELTQIKNRRYSITKKNRGEVPVLTDYRQRYIFVPCKQCYLCRQRKAREWQMRMAEDIKANPNAKIATLTFNTEQLVNIKNGRDLNGKQVRKPIQLEGYELDNEICRIAMKGFRERWRKEYGKSPRHWFITELGHGETEHVHLHGIVWEDSRYKLKGNLLDNIERIWRYGFVGKGKYDVNTGKLDNYVDERTPKYFTKYVNKIDEMHPGYKQIILTSSGIGRAYLESDKAKDNAWKGKNTNQLYQMDKGGQLPLPQYFRYKLWTEEQRIQLTSWYLDKDVIYIEGKEVSRKIGDIAISKMYKELRDKNARLGFTKHKKLEQKIHELQRRKAIHKKRFEEQEKAIRAKHVSAKELRNSTEDWVMLRQRLFELKQGEANNAGGANNGGLPRGSSVNHDVPSWKETMPKELTISENWTPEWVWDNGPKMHADEKFHEKKCDDNYLGIREINELEKKVLEHQKELKSLKTQENSIKKEIVNYYRYNTPKGNYTIRAENEAQSRDRLSEILNGKMEGVKYIRA